MPANAAPWQQELSKPDGSSASLAGAAASGRRKNIFGNICILTYLGMTNINTNTICHTCGHQYPEVSIYGRNLHCTKCIYQKERLDQSKLDKRNAYNKARRQQGSLTDRFTRTKYAAVKRGLSWSLSKEDFINLISKPCHYCQDSLVNYQQGGLDRIDNSLGYEFDNVLPCCTICNKMRNEYLTVREMELVASYIKEIRQ